MRARNVRASGDNGWRKRNAGSVVGLLLIAVMLAGFWVRMSDGGPSAVARSAPQPVESEATHEAPPIYTARPQNDEPLNHAGTERRPNPNRPIIKHASVEKTEVCRGEQDFLDVDATTSNGTDAFLAVTLIHPQTGKVVRGGKRIPFRLDGSSSRELRVVVDGKNASESITLPAVKIKDCVAPRQVLVSYQRTTDAFERIHFQAELKAPSEEANPSAEAAAASYEWDFGDGTKQTSALPVADHSYEDRDQSVARSSFLVTVRVKSAQHEDEGSTLLAFTNLGFAPLVLENKVVLSIAVAPPGPGKDEAEKIWLYHGYSKSIRLTHALLREVLIDPIDQTQHETSRREYAPEVLLGFSEIPAKESRLARDLSGLQPIDTQTIRYVEVTGQSVDGKAVVGSFSLLPEKSRTN